MQAYMRLVTINYYPISHVQNVELHIFSKYNTNIGKDELKKKIIKLVELVEQSIQREMTKHRGALMFDSWTDGRTHYLAVYAIYIREFEVLHRGIATNREEVSI